MAARRARTAAGYADRRRCQPRSPQESARLGVAFRKGLNEPEPSTAKTSWSARALGLEVPNSIQLRADEVIE